MKEYQHLIGKIIVAVAIIVAAIIIAQAIGGAGESILVLCQDLVQVKMRNFFPF